MDWLAFIAAMTGHLAWPLSAAVILLAYRAPLAERIRSIRRMKYKDLELDIGVEIRELSAKAEAVLGPLPVATPAPALPSATSLPPQGLLEQALAVTDSAPVATVLLSWSAVEQKVVETVSRLALSEAPARNPVSKNLDLLATRGDFDDAAIEVFKHLREIRNEVAHPARGGERHVSPRDATTYHALAEMLVDHLAALK